MKQTEICEKLRSAATSIEKLEADKLRGVALIALPSGEFIEVIVSGTELDTKAFLQHVVAMISAAQVQAEGEARGQGWPNRPR